MEAYTAETTNARNTVTATPADPAAAVAIDRDGTPVDNGSQVAWEDGENILTIRVQNGGVSGTYTVTVTKKDS